MAGDAEHLRRGLAEGRPEAFAALYDEYAARLHRAAIGLLGSREDAEDAVQDVFTGMVRSRAKLGAVENLGGYLFSSLRRAAIRRWEERKKIPFPPPVEAAPAPREDSIHAERLERALAALSPDQREVITLKIDGELTFREVADALGVSVNTAASRYRYALESLRASLEHFTSGGIRSS